MLHEMVVSPNKTMLAAAGCAAILLCGCPRSTVWLGTFTHAGNGAGDSALDAGIDASEGAQDSGADAMAGSSGRESLGSMAGAGASGASSTHAGKGAAGTAGSPVQAGSGGVPAAGSGGIGVPDEGIQPLVPKAPTACPKLVTGTVRILGVSVQIWAGTKSMTQKAPVLIYWHSTGTSSDEASLRWGPTIDEIVSMGGVVASPVITTGTGDNTGDTIWFTGDFAIADEVVACAVDQLNIDMRRIYSVGGSAGGMQTGAMLYERSSYIAAAISDSGGIVAPSYTLQEAMHVPAVMSLHGARGVDMVVIDFADISLILGNDVAAKHGFAVDCDHGGTHLGSPVELKAAAWQFLKDHPFGARPEPYAAGLPASFPKYCKIL